MYSAHEHRDILRATRPERRAYTLSILQDSRQTRAADISLSKAEPERGGMLKEKL
jgi:hypothetical protein